ECNAQLGKHAPDCTTREPGPMPASTPPATRPTSNQEYPASPPRTRGETDFERAFVDGLRQTLDTYFSADTFTYVASHLLVFYVPGDRRRHVQPDLMVARGVAKRDRPNYLVWEEG